jgi:DNA mismatch repair protein MutS
MITGPNMSGKSALLRQTALIVLLAQVGSFVPAAHAEIGMVDKIFTRVGASDNISSGESTFMVEMNETASILNNLTARSLILLDEIGRGTSTYDGISIAWSIAEFIHEQPVAKAKTLFATHYHELNDMADVFPRVRNFNVSVKESGNKVIFLRKLMPGGSEHSFGIHVARMAGMPRRVVDRANEVMSKLEKKHSVDLLDGKPGASRSVKPGKQDDEMQLSFFQLDDPVLEQIRDELVKTDINNLTPVEAMMKLNEIKKLIGK